MGMLPQQDKALPQELTPFLGRQAEMTALRGLLDDPACRLITLVGPGGIGKTRLAIEFAASVRDQFTDGVAFAALQSVPSVPFLASAIADGLRLPLQGQDEPRTQLLQALRDKHLLLVLDNFEHLLDGADLLFTILRAAPDVTILVTSREVLNLREEWLFPVDGLAPPDGDSGDELLASRAAQLFAACARRVRRDFDLAVEGAAVARICRLVAGMPLAIELAAAWTKTLPCRSIADEIERNLAFLEANLRDLPERHRSVRAAFDQSWYLLRADEQAVFRRLAVFRNGFTYDAAARIAGATLPLLAALTDKSLVHLDSQGRYQIHELLRQYAEGHLLADPDEAIVAQQSHAAYYIDNLRKQADDLFNGYAALDSIAIELGNIRPAWQWATAQVDLPAIRRMAYPLWAYYHQRGPVWDGIAALEQALECLSHTAAVREAAALRAELLVQLGWLLFRCGDLSIAGERFAESQQLFVELQLAPPPGYATDPVLGLARMALWRGSYGETWRLAEEARYRSERDGNEGNLAVACYLQVTAARMQGRYRVAERIAHNTLAIAERLGNDWVKAYCFDELGQIARARNALEQAQAYFQTCYDLRIARGDTQGAAMIGDQLGALLFQRGALAEAQQRYEQSIAALRQHGNRDWIVSPLNGLGMVATAQGDYEVARRALDQACRAAVEVQFAAILPTLLASIADLLIRIGRAEEGAELLTFILRNAASTDDTFNLAQRLIFASEAVLTPDLFAAAVQRGQALDTTAAIARAHVLLSVPFSTSGLEAAADRVCQAGAAPGDVAMPEIAKQALVEHLTPRELEVLELIGDGLSNQAIAERLVLSHGTVRWYTQQIYGKLGVRSRTQALARARNRRLLP